MTKSPRIKGFFIAGTDTGVGKTFVSVALTRALVARGLRAAVMKPVAAGAIDTADGPRNDDALALHAASNVRAAYGEVNPYLFALPASPHLAALAEGGGIDLEPIGAARDALAARADVLLVEGAGGWYAPISATRTMADVAAHLQLPVILVVGMRLGCLNHALLTREAIRARGLEFGGWIANRLAVEMPLCAANIDTLSARFGRPPLGIVPCSSGTQSAAADAPEAWAVSAAENLLSP